MRELITKLQKYPNEVHATIHTNIELPSFSPLSSSAAVTKALKPLIDPMLKVDGVVSARISDRYEVNIQKGVLFSWDDIYSKIESILVDYFENIKE